MVVMGATRTGDQDHCDLHSRKLPSWRCTLVTQAALCLALYAALSIGRPQRSYGSSKSDGLERSSLDLYFLSVRGGVWPVKEQNQLLSEMEKAAKIYKANFVVDIGEFGENDPLQRNVVPPCTILYQVYPGMSEVSVWYCTAASHGQLLGNFIEKIGIAHGQILDIIGLDTGPFQDLLHDQQRTTTASNQLNWLQTTLAMADSNWRIVIGFDPLIACKDNEAADSAELYEPLHHIFLKYGVNAYISQQSCAGYHYLGEDITYIGNPGHTDIQQTMSPSGSHDLISEAHGGFFLHRVSPLEIESYFIDLGGNVVFKTIIHQGGRAAM